MKLEDISQALMGRLPDALVVSDRDGIICFWNDGATRIFGFSGEEAIGQSLDIIIPENLRGRHWDGYEKSMKTGTSRYGPGDLLKVPAVTRDGRRISVEFSVFPVPDAAGNWLGIGALLRDVSAGFDRMRELEKALRDCRRQQKPGGAS